MYHKLTMQQNIVSEGNLTSKTIPYRDELVSDLTDAWIECKEVFGKDHILIVSNSVGTKGDESGIGVSDMNSE